MYPSACTFEMTAVRRAEGPTRFAPGSLARIHRAFSVPQFAPSLRIAFLLLIAFVAVASSRTRSSDKKYFDRPILSDPHRRDQTLPKAFNVLDACTYAHHPVFAHLKRDFHAVDGAYLTELNGLKVPVEFD